MQKVQNNKKNNKISVSNKPESKVKKVQPKSKTNSQNNNNQNAKKLQAEEEIRLNKFIADSGLCSRRKADELIAEHKVKVNGKIVEDAGRKVHPSDFVTVNGDPITYIKRFIYIILNKPKDVITTSKDELGRKTVLDIVRKKDRIYPVGRLDRSSTGVLLLTNDGDMANKLTHPSSEIEKLYNVELDKEITLELAKTISFGVELEDGMTAPCQVFVNPENYKKLSIVIHEGKNREIRRIFEHFGFFVRKLDRKSFGGLTAKGLKRGEYRHLLRSEVMDIKTMLSLIEKKEVKKAK